MSAADLLLTVRGQDDRWLSMAPDRTYFEAKYQPRVNRSRETYEIPFDNQDATFGSTGRCTIPVKGDYMTRLTLRTVMPPIYPTVPGQYVYPTPSSEVGATVYVNKTLDLVVADGVTLTANTVGNHYFSIGAQVTLAGTAYVIFDLDGTYTITGIPTANSFTCSTTLAGISYNGTVSSPGIQCGDIISYFSTANSNLWVNNVTNKTWQITSGTNIGTSWTFTTSAPSNFPVGSQVILNLPDSYFLNKTVNVIASTDTTFTCNTNSTFIAGAYDRIARSTDNGLTWTTVPYFGYGRSTAAFGNETFVLRGGVLLYSIDDGLTWVSTPCDSFVDIAFGNGTFVAVAEQYALYSTDNARTWTNVSLPGLYGNGIAFGNETFVTVGNVIAYSTDNGQTWTILPPIYIGMLRLTCTAVAFGNGTFVAVGPNQLAYSTDNGQTWTATAGTFIGEWTSITFGNGTFVAVQINNSIAYSTDNGQTWTSVSTIFSFARDVTFGNGTFIVVGDYGPAYSTDNGQTWTLVFEDNPYDLQLKSIAYGELSYVSSPSDSVSLVVPPLQLTNRVFSSDVYPSISFANASDAAFWGFDSREGLTYSLPATPPWTLTQSGWISGFLPPSTSTYDDSVAHKLCKSVRLLVGKQTIKEYSGEYIELQNDLLVPYENKAILKLMNGTLDQTQATVAREYYVNLPIGTKEVPLCALTHQNMSVEVDFDSYLNVSQNLNAGTGDFLDAKSYTTYDASTGLLGGQPVNVQTTFSYQQYIFIVTYGGQFIIFDTTKNVNDPASYIVLSAFSGSSLFSQFCVLSGNLYIGLTNGQLARMIITELIQGNISSFIVNNYTPTIGSLTGTIVADFRYVYYTVSNTVTSNIFMSKYDTTGNFTSPSSYTTVDFTQTFNSGVTGVYQTLTTGTELIMLPRGTPGTLYTYQLNANVQSQWYLLDYSAYGYRVTEGVLIGNSVYFVCDNFNIINYSAGIFTLYINSSSTTTLVAVGNQVGYSIDNGQSWTEVGGYWYDVSFGNNTFVTGADYATGYSTDNGRTWTTNFMVFTNYWRGVAFGNGTFVIVGQNYGYSGYSTDNGQTWNFSYIPDLYSYGWFSVTFGNGTFVAIGNDQTAYSTDNGQTWTTTLNVGSWKNVTFGNGIFIVVGDNQTAYSTNNGQTWTPVALSGAWKSASFGNGVFIVVGDNQTAYSTNNGQTWTPVALSGLWDGLTFGNGKFYAVSNDDKIANSRDGLTWVTDTVIGYWRAIIASPTEYTIPGDSLRNLIAVGNYIYCSTNNVAVQIDTTQDLSTPAAYKFPAPLPVNQYVFANGPRYVYMFAQGDNTATNIVEFDPYGPDTTFKASILVDYESLPPDAKKPDKALLGLIQTQKVTDMNYMNIKGPVKELWVTGVSATTNVFQYSNLAPRSSLALTGEKIVTEDEGTHTFLNIIEPFETHTSMPIRNVSVVAFELDPESEIPNGTINFSRIRDQVFEGGAQTVWARNYNLLKIQGGIGGLIFNS